jgi:UDP-N-acetylmuramoyl-L-alanyl-D-glutamate--2,6-diaminopimelate ligase
MFYEGILDNVLRSIKRVIPEPLFRVGAKLYHPLLAWTGGARYGFPGRKLTVIGVTGTKGKSTTVHLISTIFEANGKAVAAIGSLGYKIRERTWPNTLKMTMPGRWKMQQFLRKAVDAGCTHVVMECPSEGLAQGRHLGVRFDCAVFLNLHPEHLESHGGWENYRAAKLILFKACRTIHIINRDDPSADLFLAVPARKRVAFGLTGGDIMAADVQVSAHGSSFSVGRTRITMRLGGLFNISNALAALATADAYGIPVSKAKDALEGVHEVSGRMQWLQNQPFGVVVDYAHTPDSLEAVYKTLRPQAKRLICILGAAGGGRDTWKRSKFGALAERYCDRIYLTNEDPYDEDPEAIIEDVAAGISGPGQKKMERVLDRREAIANALTDAQEGDIVVITGKGSETSLAVAGGRKIPWSDAQIVRDLLQDRG